MLKNPTEKIPMLPTTPNETKPMLKKPMPRPLEQLTTPALSVPACEPSAISRCKYHAVNQAQYHAFANVRAAYMCYDQITLEMFEDEGIPKSIL